MYEQGVLTLTDHVCLHKMSIISSTVSPLLS